MTYEERTRLLGVRDGLNYAIVTVRHMQGSILGPGGAYLPPRHHTKKRAAAESWVAELGGIVVKLQAQLDEVKEALVQRDAEA